MKDIKGNAFTLAEVLIVIGIIGVVAALTVPTLIANYQKNQNVANLKKFYSEFQIGMRIYMSNNGCSDLTCTGLFNGESTDTDWQNNMKTELPKMFNVVKILGDSTSDSSPVSRTYLDGSSTPQFLGLSYFFQTADGFLIGFTDSDSGNCQRYSNTASFPKANKLKNSCALVMVDTNGSKPPNTYGRDTFRFELSNSGLLYVDNDKTCATEINYFYWRELDEICGTAGSSKINSGTVGIGCAARIIEEGWEMNY